MRDRHWTQLSEQMGFSLHPDKSFTLTKAEGMGLMDHLDIITRVSDVAGVHPLNTRHPINIVCNQVTYHTQLYLCCCAACSWILPHDQVLELCFCILLSVMGCVWQTLVSQWAQQS